MRFIDFKIWLKLSVVYGLFMVGYIALSVWDYVNINNLDTEFLASYVFAHGALAVFFTLVFVGFIIIVSKSFRSTLQATERLAQGDLTGKIVPNRKDELGQIESSLAILQSRMRHVIEHVKETTANLIAASSELNSGSQLISTGANDQAAASTEISMTMDQVAMIAKQTTDSSNETNAIAKVAYQGILKGAEDLMQALAVIEDIAQKNSIISEIAYQTKILSINASIEAARSSEFGKGFSVIAEHIKKLAETTQISASEIQEVSKKGVQLTRDSATMLQELVAELQKTTELTQQVADSGAEQYAAIDQINLSMQELNNITQQNASSSEELTASSEELVRLSETLSEQIDFFKLSEADLQHANEHELAAGLAESGSEEEHRYSYTPDHSFQNDEIQETEYSRQFQERIKRRMEELEKQENDYSSVAESSFVNYEQPKVEPSKSRNNVDDFLKNSEVEYDADVSTKVQHGGVKINLSDNDDIDSQFERIK
jgi:methyl-accepting chemotaxis protein